MKVLVSGSTGLVGSELMAALSANGHDAVRLARTSSSDGRYPSIQWDPIIHSLNTTHLEGLDAVVHLAGDNIASGRWTDYKKQQIKDSRVKNTRFLCESLAKLKNPPKVLICASATGFYGDRGSENLDENSAKGQGFLADVCQEWEDATQPARDAGIRVVNLRTGIVLSPQGGALQKVLPLFLLGGGGILGNGKQVWSWISLPDLVDIIRHALQTDNLSGPVNAVTPNPVSNAEFTQTLGKVLKRPALFPAPAFMLKLIVGEMADALLLGSAKVEPSRLKESGYTYQHETLEIALRHLLGK